MYKSHVKKSQYIHELPQLLNKSMQELRYIYLVYTYTDDMQQLACCVMTCTAEMNDTCRHSNFACVYITALTFRIKFLVIQKWQCIYCIIYNISSSQQLTLIGYHCWTFSIVYLTFDICSTFQKKIATIWWYFYQHWIPLKWQLKLCIVLVE